MIRFYLTFASKYGICGCGRIQRRVQSAMAKYAISASVCITYILYVYVYIHMCVYVLAGR